MRLGTAGSSRNDIIWIMMWMLVACVSILIHEFGHALTARKLSGGRNYIKLWAMGGLAYHEGGKPTRKSRLWTIAMGPGAGLIVFVLTCVAIVAAYGTTTGPMVIQTLITNKIPASVNRELYDLLVQQPPLLRVFDMLIWINFWWSLVNLLPVFPLDGGQFLSTWTGKTLLAYKVGAVTGAIAAVVGLLVFRSLYVGLLFGFFAYQNYKNLQNFSGSNQWR